MAILGSVVAQEIVRKAVDVPKVDPTAMVIDGVMDEAAWQNAGQANLMTADGFEIWANMYGREDLAEPEYDELYGRLLWADDTLYVFMHIDEFVNDSTNLFFAGAYKGDQDAGDHWKGDQLFLGLSNRAGIEQWDNWEGNPWMAPDGPYHLMIMGDRVTFNDGFPVWTPEAYRPTFTDSLIVYDTNFIRSGITIDTLTGIWDVELAIYNPNAKAGACLAFNVGGSTGSRWFYEYSAVEWGGSDAYGYYTWQPNVPDDPWTAPFGLGWCATYIQQNSEYWAKLNLQPGVDDVIIRKEVEVPQVDPTAIVIDGMMNETAWQNAGQANLMTADGFEIWANMYGREDLAEPEYDELYGRLLWADDTLYVFMHIDEFVNDSTNLFFAGAYKGDQDAGDHWKGDQLFMGLSNRLGIEQWDNWEGNPWSAPDGPYHLMIMGDRVTFNDGFPVWTPEAYRPTFADSLIVYDTNFIRSGITIDTLTGIWDVELAIYHPHVKFGSCIGFNVGGSTGSRWFYEYSAVEWGGSDAYGYYTWQPNVPDDPWTAPFGLGWCATYIQQNSEYWAKLQFVAETTGVEAYERGDRPVRFALQQNYPNPFNPKTNIRFFIAQNGPVTLKVYNLVGQVVTTLINEEVMAAGTYTVSWDASHMANGIYLYQLEAGGVIQTKKMTLMK